MQKHINKDYKKCNKRTVKNITKNDKKIAEKLDLEDRIYRTKEKQAFIQLKDHKPNFVNNTTCRLLNPTKSEIAKIAKKKLINIVEIVREKTKLKQWKNTDSVIRWFNHLRNKQKLLFIQFNVVNFYGSISQDLLENSLTFAARHTRISASTKSTIMQATNSFLFSDKQAWVKQNGGTFDVTMGGYHGAEICE